MLLENEQNYWWSYLVTDRWSVHVADADKTDNLQAATLPENPLVVLSWMSVARYPVYHAFSFPYQPLSALKIGGNQDITLRSSPDKNKQSCDPSLLISLPLPSHKQSWFPSLPFPSPIILHAGKKGSGAGLVGMGRAGLDWAGLEALSDWLVE